MNELDLVRYKKAIPLLKELDRLLLKEYDLFGQIITEYSDKINSHNINNLTVVNPTKGELGRVRTAFKKRILSHVAGVQSFRQLDNKPYWEDHDYSARWEQWNDKNEEAYTKHRDIVALWYNAIENTVFSEEAISAKIILMRKRYWQRSPLLVELNETILTTACQEFCNQNKDFITKHT